MVGSQDLKQVIHLIISIDLLTTIGMYYLRTRPAVNAIQFTVDRGKLDDTGYRKHGSPSKSPVKVVHSSEDKIILENVNNQMFVFEKEEESTKFVCNLEEGCLMCGS